MLSAMTERFNRDSLILRNDGETIVRVEDPERPARASTFELTPGMSLAFCADGPTETPRELLISGEPVKASKVSIRNTGLIPIGFAQPNRKYTVLQPGEGDTLWDASSVGIDVLLSPAKDAGKAVKAAEDRAKAAEERADRLQERVEELSRVLKGTQAELAVKTVQLRRAAPVDPGEFRRLSERVETLEDRVDGIPEDIRRRLIADFGVRKNTRWV